MRPAVHGQEKGGHGEREKEQPRVAVVHAGRGRRLPQRVEVEADEAADHQLSEDHRVLAHDAAPDAGVPDRPLGVRRLLRVDAVPAHLIESGRKEDGTAADEVAVEAELALQREQAEQRPLPGSDEYSVAAEEERVLAGDTVEDRRAGEAIVARNPQAGGEESDENEGDRGHSAAL